MRTTTTVVIAAAAFAGGLALIHSGSALGRTSHGGRSEARPSVIPDDEEISAHLLSKVEPIGVASPPAEYSIGVELWVTVDRRGRVASVKAVGGVRPWFARAVTQARGWRFRPFRRNGHPVRVIFDEFIPTSLVEDRLRHGVPIPHGPLSSLRITLTRDGCYGSCPVYSVEIRGNGTVTYHGRTFVLISGRHVRVVPTTDVRALLDRFRSIDFGSLQREYRAAITDSARYTISLTVGRLTRTVTDYVGTEVGMPASVSALEDQIDRTAGTEQWVEGDEHTLAGLEAEHWDFHSRLAADTLARAAPDAPQALVMGLIERGAPVNGVGYGKYGEANGVSALDGACRMARLEIARALIAKGALEARRGARESALREAATSGHPAMVAEILKFHPDVNARDSDGQTPLMSVEEGGSPFGDNDMDPADYPAVIRLMLAAGADPNLQDKDGDTVLHQTVDPDNARAYIAGGARLEIRNKGGETPLLAAFAEDVAVILIEAGADISAKAQDGHTIQETAELRKWNDVLAALAKRRVQGR